MQISMSIWACVLLSILIFVSDSERFAAQEDAVKAKTGAPAAEMYGEIGKIVAVSGKRDEVIANILAGVGNMPGVSITSSRKT